MNTTSTNALDYSSSTVLFTILSSQAPIPAPKLFMAQFSDAVNYMYIIFDSATDKGLMTANAWSCNNAFIFNGANTTSCAWLNSTFIKATFAAYDGSANNMNIGDFVTAIANITKAQCFANCTLNAYSVTSSVKSVLSNNPVTPGPVLLVPQTISSCTNLTVDATLSSGSAGRYWLAVDWKIDAFTGSALDGSKQTIYPYDALDVLLSFGLKIDKPINIPIWLLQEATYSITLTLTNFLGQSSSTSATVQVTGNRNLPTLNIVGSNILTVTPASTVLVYSNAEVSSCSESQNIQYSWVVFKAGGISSGIESVSSDPKILVIASHTLQVGTVYQAEVTALVKVGETDNTASSLITIQVVNGPIKAVVRGGYYRAVFIPKNLVLDASTSTDSNLPSTTADQGLSFQWTCTITSTANYGQDCSSVFNGQSTTTSVVTLSGSLVLYGVIYSFGIKATSADGRTDSNIVTVQNLLAPSISTQLIGPDAFLASNYIRFNADSQVIIFGYVQATYAITASWTASVSGDSVPFSPLTAQTKNFTTSEAMARTSYPLSIPGNTFIPGSSVTFRIGANMQGATDTSLYAYSEIVLMVNAPPSGGFLTSNPLNGEPLSTIFALQSAGWVDDPSDYPLTFDFVYSINSVLSTIKARSTASVASTSLPAGLEANDYLITLYNRAFLFGGLSSATSSGDLSFAIQVVNNVANTLNVVNCTGVNITFCAFLNRETYGECEEPDLKCPAGDANFTCSGHGLCQFTDPSGNVLTSCKISNTQCTASCICDAEGYGGADCSLSSEELTNRDTSRTAMCQAIVTVANSSNPSTQQMETLVNSLLASYSPTEVVSDEGIAVCRKALSVIAHYASDGLLAGAVETTTKFLVQTASNFVTRAQSNVNTSGETSGSDISASVGNILDGVLQSMVNGQAPVVVLTDNIRMTALLNSVSSLSQSALTPPATDAELLYGAALPSISFSNLSASACDSGGGYVQMSLMSWGTNPFPGPANVTTPILRLDTTTTITTNRRRKLMSYPSDVTPAYFVTLQFSAKQDFNFSLNPNQPVPHGSNVTFPECRLYNSETASYESCRGCNITSYTNYNV
eukprot:gene47457-biopygen27981